MTNPILVEVTRGTTVESIHRGAACVVDLDGKVVDSWGDVDALTCPRSALKPMQALPLIETGAAARFVLTDEELALACASHNGEPEHVRRVEAWLARAGFSVRDLECGAHVPMHAPAAEALMRAGGRPCPIHNNCSGKHTGFLCLAVHLNAPTKGYTEPAHAVQREAFAAIGTMADVEPKALPIVRDGCSAPNLFMPLKNLALAWARMGQPAKLAKARAAAARRIVDAMKTHGFLFSGTDRPCLALTQSLAGRGVAKVGAEGIYAACEPERGLGIAVKIDDGAARAASVALAAILNRLGAFKPAAGDAVAKLLSVPHKAWAGAETGVVRVADGWLT
ncbi:MAG: asparaginase [Rhodospirillaceae bacterium]|nr:asparaginase [Rhodospirillaceae bacterium]